MKKMFIIIGTALALLSVAKVNANPYFRLIGPGNYGLYDGALFSTKGIKQTQNTTLVPLVTHSTVDGSLLPQPWVDAGYAEAWTPFALGGSEGAGNATVNFGPILNVGPVLQTFLLNNVIPTSAVNLRSHFATSSSTGFDVTFAAGVMLNAQVIQNGTFMPINRWWSEPFRFYFGPKLRF